MKRSIVILAIELLSLSACLGQVNTKIGDPYPFIETEKQIYFAEDKEILAVKIAERRIYLQKFNSESLSAETMQIYNDMPRGSLIEKITKLKNKYFLFYSWWDGEYQNLLYREINFKEGTFMSIGENIFKTKGKIGAPDKDFPHNRFKFSFSADSSKILILGRKPSVINNDSKSFDVISMQVYDENVKMVWSQEVEMPYSEKKMDALNYSVGSKGDVYIVAKIYKDALTSKENYRIGILNIEAGKTTVSKTLIASVSKFVKNILLYEHPTGYLIGVGIYNLGEIKNDNSDGIMLFKVSHEGGMYDAKTYEIPIEVVNLYDKRKDGDKEKFENLELNSIYIQKDESLLILCEQKREREQFQEQVSYTYKKPMVYIYNDIIVTKIDISGNLVWMRRLPNRQKTAEISAESFQYAKIKDRHNFLIVEDFKNINLPLTENPSGHTIGGPGLLTTYSIENDNGKVSKTMLLDTRSVNGLEIFQLTTRRIVRTSENEFVLEAYKRDEEDILIKVRLQD